MSEQRCPIWGTEVREIHSHMGDYTRIDSARVGGWYAIAGSAEVAVQSLNDNDKARLTTWLIDERRVGVQCPTLTTYAIERILLRSRLEVNERAQKLLECIETKLSDIGDRILVGDALNPTFLEFLGWSESTTEKEVSYLLNYLQSVGWTEAAGTGSPTKKLRISPKGYAHLADLKKTSVLSTQAFIAMWFDPSMNAAFVEGIEPACLEAGYSALRVDRKDHNNKIDDEIIAEIRRSRFVVADFTQADVSGARGGVYYEAGFAHGLNIPVIFTCNQDAIAKVHFDTRQYNHITWSTPPELKERLSKRISATIGDGPLRRPPRFANPVPSAAAPR